MLLIHRAERADVLAEALAGLLLDVPADPFAAELVAVPTRGIERWLTQRLSAHLGSRPGGDDGVCANIEFPFPGRLVAEALAVASGISPERDPWLPARLVWPLVEVVEAASEEPWLAPLARHLATGREQRFARLAHVARLFHEYAVRRPALIEAWAAGESGGIDERAAAGWQPELWRRLREALGVPSLAERLPAACAAIEADPPRLALPPRLTLFGLTRLPVSHLRVLRALAVGRDVHLMLLHPSPALWDAGRARNRLLDSWGRDVHGLQGLVRGSGRDVHHPLPGQGPARTLLETLQRDIREDRPPPGPPLREGAPDARIGLAPEDRSIRLHACHGRARQVDVLREVILHRLADDPTLEPRDVIVMCPDIEAFAPLIEAAFGAPVADGELAAGDPPALRVRLADRSLRRTTPVLAVVARLLELASSRVTASEVLDLADAGPVRSRFGFDDEELTQVREWVAAAHIHWGLDAEGRARYRLTDVEAGTWAAGLKRLLLGVALDPEGAGAFGGVLPAVAVQSSQIELAGRFAEFVDRLDAALRSLAGPQSLAAWCAALAAAADGLTATASREAWQRRQLDAILAEVADEAVTPRGAGAPGAVELFLGEVRELLAHRLEGRPTRANFRSGHLTFCTLVPMRSVPHRLVCLLGLDDGAFPRQSPRDGDDLLLDDPQPGDRDPRTEDRQLLLDALLAAQEALVITYSGNDERTNAPLPPAVPVGELLDAIDATARIAGATPEPPHAPGRRARELVLVRHPLQAFDPRNFTSRGSDPARAADGPWSFDRAALQGARALLAPRRHPSPFLPAPLPPAPEDDLVTLEELVAFAQRPVRAFLRQRLEVFAQWEEDEIDDALPIELDALERWDVGQRLLDAVLAGRPAREAVLSEIARGALPPGELGRPVVRELWPDVQAIAAAVRAQVGSERPRSEQTNITLPGGLRLTGTVGGVHGHVLLAAGYSRLGPRQRLATWIRLLALTAANPEIPFEAVTIGRGAEPGSVQVIRIPQLGSTAGVRAGTALAELGPLTALRAEGLRAPLPVPCRTGHAYAEAALQTGEDPVAAALRRWRSGWYNDRLIQGEEEEPEHRLAIGQELDVARLAELATALWRPLFAHEVGGG
ncbi:MAG TPA: exodeoxyribonuclease V subunit gamma [Solirubrobacteraceae bacterium]|nr:exodeoxyribonuclease V subunit gamma [Solirubrobacteraceae bacterium]